MEAGKKAGSLQKKLFKRYGLPENTEEKYPFECSGGMTRRILLTTALMGNPKLIIADEPTPGMDLELAKKSMEDFRRFADEGNGVLLITHDIELALQVADRIVVFLCRKNSGGGSGFGFPIQKKPCGILIRKRCGGRFRRMDLLRLQEQQPYVKDMPEGCPLNRDAAGSRSRCKGEIPMVQAGCGSVRCVRYCERKSISGQIVEENN